MQELDVCRDGSVLTSTLDGVAVHENGEWTYFVDGSVSAWYGVEDGVTQEAGIFTLSRG